MKQFGMTQLESILLTLENSEIPNKFEWLKGFREFNDGDVGRLNEFTCNLQGIKPNWKNDHIEDIVSETGH